MQEWVYVVLSIALIFDKLDLEVKKEINFTIFDLQKKKKRKEKNKRNTFTIFAYFLSSHKNSQLTWFLIPHFINILTDIISNEKSKSK